jgi:hypothetical protein
MTNHTPPTNQQLDDIEARANAATPGPWHLTDADTIVAPLSTDTIADVWEPTGMSRNGEFIEAAREAVPALVAEVRRLQTQRRILLGQLARKDAESGAGDKALREFLGGGDPAAPDPICGDENDGDFCDLEPGHDGDHCAGATVGWPAAAAVPAPAGE